MHLSPSLPPRSALRASAQKKKNIPYLLLAVGIGIRLQQYLAGRSLWVDEATLALNIGTRSFLELLSPLDYHQTAPLGYLWAVRVVTSVLGMGERSLRLLSLLAGCAALVLVWRLGRRLIGEMGGAVALALAAFAPAMIYYSNEAKPYGTDTLVAAVLLALAARTLDPAPDARGWRLLALAGAVAVWCSAPAVFVLAGIGVVAAIAALRATDRARLARVAGTGAVWVASFLGAYLAVYRNTSRSAYMQDYWEQGFLTVGSLHTAARSVRDLWEILWEFFVGIPSDSIQRPYDLILLGGLALVLIALMLLGFLRIRRLHGTATAWLIPAPALIVVAASFAHVYPVSTRLLIFLLPAAIVLIAAGMVRAAERLAPARRGPVLAALSVAFALASIPPGGRWAMASMQWSGTRETIETLEADGGATPVYVYARAIPAYAWYTTDWSAPAPGRLRDIHTFWAGEQGDGLTTSASGRREVLGHSTGVEWRAGIDPSTSRPDAAWAGNEARRIRAAADPEVWVLFTHSVDGAEEPLVGEIERQGGIRRDRLKVPGVMLYRYLFQ